MSVLLNQKEYSGNISQYPGYYEYRELKLKRPGDTQEFDLIPFVAELNLFEALDASCMTGSITLVDTENLIKQVPIIGEETLKMVIWDQFEEYVAEYKIYKISDRKQLNFGVLGYTLHFCSAEMYRNAFTRVSKAYDQQPYEKAIVDIVQNYLKSDKFVIHSNTKYPQCFIIPNWNPLAACKWMASRAQDEEYTGGNFVFYEDKDQFNFVALENLLDETKNKPFAEISYDPLRKTEDKRHVYDKRQKRHVMRFEHMEVKKSLDVLENMTFGMYKNKVKLVDIVQRGTVDTDYDYMLEFDKSTHLKGFYNQSHPLSSSENEATKEDATPEMDSRLFVRHKGLFTNEIDGGSKVEEWYSPRLSQMMQMNNFVLQGTLPGQLEMKVGMIVKFNMPNIQNIDQKQVLEPDLAYSGNYLITSLRRMFQRDKFYIIVEMVKDSMSLDRDAVRI